MVERTTERERERQRERNQFTKKETKNINAKKKINYGKMEK